MSRALKKQHVDLRRHQWQYEETKNLRAVRHGGFCV